MGSDDLYKNKRRVKRKQSVSSTPQGSAKNETSYAPSLHDIFQPEAFLNSASLLTSATDVKSNSVQQQVPDAQMLIQYQFQAMMEWKKNFEEWQNKYGESLRRKGKRRAHSAKIRAKDGKRRTIISTINIGDDSTVLIADKTMRIAERRPPYLLRKACSIAYDFGSNYYSTKRLSKNGKDVFVLETFSFNDKHPLLELYKGFMDKETTPGKVVNFITECIKCNSCYRLSSSNTVLWHYAGSVVKNKGVPDMSELAQYFMYNSNFTKLLDNWNTEFIGLATSSPLKKAYATGNNHILNSLEYFMSVRAWGAAFSLCGSDSSLHSYVQQRYIRETGKLNPLSTCFSFINREPIAFLKTSIEEFVANYQNHLLVILVFSNVNAHSARSITHNFAERLALLNIWNIAHFCYLVSGCYPSYNFNDDKYQLIGYYDELSDDLLDKDHFIESIFLNEVIEYGLKQNGELWRNSMEFKLYIIRFLLEAKDYRSARTFAKEFALRILQEPEQFSKFVVYQLYSLAEITHLCLKCYENTFSPQPKWLACLKDVYKGNAVKFVRSSTPQRSSLKKKKEELINSCNSTIKPQNTDDKRKKPTEAPKKPTESSPSNPLKEEKIDSSLKEQNFIDKTEIQMKTQAKVQCDEIDFDNVDPSGAIKQLTVSSLGFHGDSYTATDEGNKGDHVNLLTVDHLSKGTQQNALLGVSAFAESPLMSLSAGPKRKSCEQNDTERDGMHTGGSGLFGDLVGKAFKLLSENSKSGGGQLKDNSDKQDSTAPNEQPKPQGPTVGKFDPHAQRRGVSSIKNSSARYVTFDDSNINP